MENRQISALKRGLDVVIATPGRLLDLHGRNFVDLSGVEYFVLDEADRMLDMGFVRDVRRSLPRYPKTGSRCCSLPLCPMRSQSYRNAARSTAD